MAGRFNRVFVSLTSVMAVLLFVSIVIWNMDGRMLPGRGDVEHDMMIRQLPKSVDGTILKAEDWPTSSKDTHARNKEPRKHRIVIIGSGPTALGAAKRLYDLGQGKDNSVITILEELGRPGGLASSTRDDKGFLWDVGVHVVFSHYTYFDRVLNTAVPEWNYRRRASFAFMKGSDQNRRFIPYPVQNNIHVMDKIDQRRCIRGLEEITKNPINRNPTNFDEWLVQNFGEGLADVFMRKYNRKIWTVDTNEMNSAWVGERVAVPDIEEIKTKIKEVDSGKKAKDSEWGPNLFFRFPKYNGTGGIWESVARLLPNHWFRFHEKVISIDVDRKFVVVETGTDIKMRYALEYDTLISTVPLDSFTFSLKSKDRSLKDMRELASQLVYTHTHIVGVGLTGQQPKSLADKSWVYFPDSDSPFYRVTMFSNYSDDHVPKEGLYWSLMCEIAEPQRSSNPSYWSRENLIKESIEALVLYGFITADMVVSKYYQRFEHGYPVPSLKRDIILNVIQPWLKTKGIYSRGRFGGWRYEVANQDHSFMQGVEAVDKILSDVPELTYPDPNLANSKKNTDRTIPLDYEIVIAHYNEDLDWLKPYADHTLLYHQGKDLGPPFQFYSWERLENLGREAHAYLHHITTYYDRLADVTVFAQADHMSGRCYETPLEYIDSAKKGVPCMKLPERYRDWGRVKFVEGYLEAYEKKGDPIQRATATFRQVYEHLYGHKAPRRGIWYCWNACFGATKQQIRRHPPEFYKKALAYVSRCSNQEEAHYLERLWYHFFEGVDTS
ncbi:uncharacterized protein LOC119735468 isoform X2 [Patiria miniata]|uniref:Amine oxidase domain-containing protein n=1 Tax=Patiria miniata TaxID=46514 RepID=A0A914ANM4_PATMI|nr:uncharacterized protein LOC119735468 isoform X2 [Patiria miniata]